MINDPEGWFSNNKTICTKCLKEKGIFKHKGMEKVKGSDLLCGACFVYEANFYGDISGVGEGEENQEVKSGVGSEEFAENLA